jgi:hypothetical protein
MRDHRTTQELELIVGPKRESQPPRSVASAERELRLRSEGEAELFERKLSRSGAIAAGTGVVCIVWALVALIPFLVLRGGEQFPVDPNAPLLFRWFDRFFVAVAALEELCGILLLVGGLGLRKRKPWAPVVASVPLVLVVVYCLVFTVGFVQAAFSFKAPSVMGFGFAGFALVIDALWLFLLWLPMRFFLSPRVRQACERAVA